MPSIRWKEHSARCQDRLQSLYESLRPTRESSNKRNKSLLLLIWWFPKMVVPQNGWFLVENPTKIDDLGVPLWLRKPPFGSFWEPNPLGSAVQPFQLFSPPRQSRAAAELKVPQSHQRCGTPNARGGWPVFLPCGYHLPINPTMAWSPWSNPVLSVKFMHLNSLLLCTLIDGPLFFRKIGGMEHWLMSATAIFFEVQKLSYVLTLWYSCGGK